MCNAIVNKIHEALGELEILNKQYPLWWNQEVEGAVKGKK